MLDIQAIRRALADTLRDGISRTPNIYAYLPDNPALPCLAVTAGDPYLSYNLTLGQAPECELRLLVRVCTAGRAEDAMIFLDDMLSTGSATTSSIIDALAADPTLGGAVIQCTPSIAQLVPDGDQNAGRFEATVPVVLWLRQD